MLYALNGSTIRTTPILTQIEAAARAGYAGLEIWFDKVDEHVAGGGSVSEIRRALDEHGLSVPTCIYLGDWFDTTGDAYQRALDECQRRFDIAAELGAPYVIAGPPLGSAPYDLGAQHYRELLELGARVGVKPSMEFLGFVEQLNTIEEALEIITRCAHPDATTVIDPAHIYRGGGSVESLALLTSDQIAVAHFDDCPADVPREIQQDEHRVWPGDGIFDLTRYLQLLRQTGYNRFLSLELFREDLWSRNPFHVATEGLEKMRSVVEKTSDN